MGDRPETIARIRKILGDRSPVRITRPGLIRAAVLVPLCWEGDEEVFLLIRRAEEVEHHKGQVAFPGGAVEASDGDARAAALREAGEEIGLLPDSVEILGEMDDEVAVVSNFVVTPVVAFLRTVSALHVSRREVAEVFTVPLRLLSDPTLYREEFREQGGERVWVPYYQCGERLIWGVTARIIRRLLTMLPTL